MHHKVIIIGSGPAGLTAAIYTARANLSPTVIEGIPSSSSDQPGGQLMLTTDVENFPGFVDGILGPDLMANMRAQAQRFGAEFVTNRVSKVDLTVSPKQIWVQGDDLDADATVTADAVIIATGAQALMLGLDRETDFVGHGLSTCATCDGFFFRDKEIIVVGGGDSALEEAMFLTRFASKVNVVHRRNELRASQIMQDRAKANEKINFVWNSRVVEYLGDTTLTGVRLEDTITGETREMETAGLFISIGHRPSTQLFEGQLDIKDNGYLVTQPDSAKTNIAGVFACGDVTDDYYRQAITAAGSGCKAALDAERWFDAQ